jgi:sodium-type flagellar protein MotY
MKYKYFVNAEQWRILHKVYPGMDEKLGMKQAIRTLFSASYVAVLWAMLAAINPVRGITQYHFASLAQSEWRLADSDYECMLIHDIPRYGRAVFWQVPGSQLQFALQVLQPPVKEGLVTVRSTPPGWKHDAKPRKLGKMEISKGETPIHWHRKLALRLFYELENGMSPCFSYSDWADGTDEVKVLLSTVRFRDVLPKFKQCVRALTRWEASNAELSNLAETARVYFATDSSELTEGARLTLSKLASELKLSPKSRTLQISGHADLRGTDTYNDRLSKRRAKAVKDYLVSLGVRGMKVRIRYFGERRPVDPKNTEQAWARNRRAAIFLIK